MFINYAIIKIHQVRISSLEECCEWDVSAQRLLYFLQYVSLIKDIGFLTLGEEQLGAGKGARQLLVQHFLSNGDSGFGFEGFLDFLGDLEQIIDVADVDTAVFF